MPVTPNRLTQDRLKQSTNPVISRLVANHFYLDAKDCGVTMGRDVQRASLELTVNGQLIDSKLDGLTADLEVNNKVVRQRVLAIDPLLKELYEVSEKAYAQPCRSTIEKAVSSIVKSQCQSDVVSRIRMESKHQSSTITSEVTHMSIPGIRQPIPCNGTKMIWSLVDVDEAVYRRIQEAEIIELEKKKNPSTPRTAAAIDRQIAQLRDKTIPKKVYQLTEIQVSNRLLQEALMNNDWENVRKLVELLTLCDSYLAECKVKIERMMKKSEYADVAFSYMNTTEYNGDRFIIHEGFNFERFVKEYKNPDANELMGLIEKYNEMTVLKQTLDETNKSAKDRVANFHAVFKEKQPILEDPNDNALMKFVKTIAIVISTCLFFVPGYYAYQKLWKYEKGAELSEQVERLVSTPAP